MKKFAAVLAVMLALSFSTLAQKVKVTANRDIDSARFKTYAWQTSPADQPADHMVTPLEVFEKRLKPAVDEELGKKGYTCVPTDKQPDFVIVYTILLDMQSGSGAVSPDAANSNTKFENIWVVTQLEGILTLELREAGSGKTFLEAKARAVVDPKKQERRLKDIVPKMFSSLPNKKK